MEIVPSSATASDSPPFSVTASDSPPPSEAVFVLVERNKNNERVLKWTLDNLISKDNTVVLVLVRPPIVYVPTPMGNYLPLSLASPEVVKSHVRCIENQTSRIFRPLQNICRRKQIDADILVLENPSVAAAIVQYVSRCGIKKLVIGSSGNFFTRRMKTCLPATISLQLPRFCSLYTVCKGRLVSVKASPDVPCKSPGTKYLLNRNNIRTDMRPAANGASNSSVMPNTVFKRRRTDTGFQNRWCLRRLKVEVKNLKKICEKVFAKGAESLMSCGMIQIANARIHRLNPECQGYRRPIDDAKEKSHRRDNLMSFEKVIEADEYQSTDSRYRKYTMEELEVATNFFSESLKIGEGGYGSVYKGVLDHTTVAIKVLQNNATKGRQEFQQELDVLGCIQHPHIVLLLGACPEHGSLVYEYMANGSLEDLLFSRGAGVHFPWNIRLKIAFETATALNFLHMNKPPIVHRDLKPGNILLDHNYVSKIGDVGLSKLVPPEISYSVTEYKITTLAGTFFYMDPEYQRTGIVTARSDVYALGIILLQLLTAMPPKGITQKVETAIENGLLAEIIDVKAGSWPLEQAIEFARLALSCSSLQRKQRPELETIVIPRLKSLTDLASAYIQQSIMARDLPIPKHFYCPILQEIMEDPYISADGLSYEYKAIKDWLQKHKGPPRGVCSPFPKELIPNHALRLAIMEWKKRNLAVIQKAPL